MLQKRLWNSCDVPTRCIRAPDVVVWRRLSIIVTPAISDPKREGTPRESGLLGGTLVRGCPCQNLLAAFCMRQIDLHPATVLDRAFFSMGKGMGDAYACGISEGSPRLPADSFASLEGYQFALLAIMLFRRHRGTSRDVSLAP
jgi:hypothetical protein